MKNIDYAELEAIHFRYERLIKLVEMVQIAVAEGGGNSKYAIEYSLYEILNCLEENNESLGKLLKNIPITKTEAEERKNVSKC